MLFRASRDFSMSMQEKHAHARKHVNVSKKTNKQLQHKN